MSVFQSESAHVSGEVQTQHSWIAWAVYLGMSWTWCIGMFLPVLLIRDYGFWAWVIFAVPNVVGAAAMGWVLDKQGSENISTNHRFAVLSFSAITTAFQLFFAAWVLVAQLDQVSYLLVPILLATAVFVATLFSPTPKVIVAGLVFLCSVFCLVVLKGKGGGLHTLSTVLSSVGSHDPRNIAGLTGVCILGFGLCPYLDATFLRARRELDDSNSRRAFGSGFGIFFFAMIVFSLLYAPGLGNSLVLRSVRGYLIAHWLIQIAFTVAAHWTEGDQIGSKRQSLQTVASATVIALVAIVSLVFFSTVLDRAGELIYRLFLSFYGLIFPAYVWICMIPTRGRARPTPMSLRVFAGACIVAGPMYWMGFIEKQMIWLVPGVAVVLLARLFVRTHPDVNVRLEASIDQQNSAPIS